MVKMRCGNRILLGVVMLLGVIGVRGECNSESAATLEYEIDEGLNSGAVVANIASDLPPNLGPTYNPSFFLDDETKNTFNIDYNTGIIKTRIKLDRETKSFYAFDIEKGSSSICIKVTVLDINEFAPEFSNPFRTIEIYEGAPHHRASTLGSAIDKDYGRNAIDSYYYDSGSVDYAFNVSTRKSADNQRMLLDLNVNGTLDYETTPEYTLLVEVYDGGSPSLTSTMQVKINILDKNDNVPIFNQSKYFAAILENSTVGTSILEVHATDQDSGKNGEVTYSIDRTSDPDECFVINPQTGVIRLNKPLDFESIPNYKIFAIASDGGNQSNSFSAFIEIEVLNVNEVPADIYITYLVADNTPRIPENASIGFVVARVSVSDPEAQEPDSSSISVSLQGGEGRFRLEETGVGTFLLKVNKTLDRETKAAYNLTLIAADSGTPPLSASKSFLLQLEDINDHAPVFSKSLYEPFVNEMSEPGSSVLLVTATDRDAGENARISYSIQSVSGGNSDWFQVDSISGLVTTRGQVDCEVNSHPSFWLVATDQGVPAQSSSASVVVSVSDINDKEPTFDQSLYQASIPEDKPIRSCILQVNATDPDCGVNGQIRYSIVSSEVSSWFTVEQYSGNICINKQLDYEVYTIYQFAVVATDSGNFTTTANVEVSIQDINDNVPVFYPRNYSMNIQDSSQPGSAVITVQASDEDSGDYGVVTYSIVSGNSDGKFTIDPASGTITVVSSLPAGERVYRLVIDAVDGGQLSADQMAEVYISVTGPDSNPPTFEQRVYKFSVSELVEENSFVGRVRATYAGSSENINYTISTGDKNSFFKIDSVQGIIRTARMLDHDEYPFLVLGVKASIGRTPLFGSTQVNITVEDENDNAPHFTNTHLTASVSENANSAVTIYSAYASDKDSPQNGNGVVRYSLTRNPQFLFNIDATSGEIHLAPGASLDYETFTQHELVIEARDQGTIVQSASMTLVVNVQDANDNEPMFNKASYQFTQSEKSAVSEKVGQIVAFDRDSGENGRISYSIVDSDVSTTFGIFPSDGFIYLKNVLDREVIIRYTFKVLARDHGQPSLSTTTVVTVNVQDYNDNIPAFTQSEYHFYIEENQPSQKRVGLVQAFDADTGNNAVLQYDISSANNDFAISNDGYIHTKRSLDREMHPEYNVEVTVRDSGNPSLQATVAVLITVTDINDHAPVIQNTQFMEQVDENKSKGVRIVQIVAKDPDAGDNGTISFDLVADENPKDLDYFAIHPSSGWITTTEVLDYEEKNKYNFQIVATDAGSPPRSTYQKFEIRVNDMNDEGPVFTRSANETFYVVENTPIGTTVGSVEAYDRDGGENGRVSYYIIGGNRFGLFSVAMETGVITTVRDIDYEEYSSDDVTIKAIDNSVYNPKSSIITIKIHVIDVNDNTPVFEKDPVFLTVRENIAISKVIHRFTATDADSGLNGTVRYEIMKASVEGKFEIDPTLGKLSVRSLIDYEEFRSIDLVIKAIDQAPTAASRLFTTVTVYILVQDENDNAPVFHSYQPINLREDEPVGYRIMSVIASDADGNVNKSGNNNVTYSITSGNINGTFTIGYLSGVLSIASPLDRESVSSYTLLIKARDHGSPYLESDLAFVVHITDVNDNAPRFLQPEYQANITEYSGSGSIINTPVTKVSAIDEDAAENGLLTYRISDGTSKDYFNIDPVTGFITLATNDFDREQKSSHTLTVYVQDSGYPTLYDTAIVVINVTDINDSAPKFKDSLYQASIPENQTQEDIHTFVAYDADIGENAMVKYSISDGSYSNRFMINPDTGVLTTREALDRESVAYYVLTIQATDGKFSDTCQINITVIDINDNSPIFVKSIYEKLLYENAALETTVITVKATDSDEGDNGRVTYSLHNDTDASLFEIDPVTGVITTKGIFDREKKSKYIFDAIASDEGLYNRRSTQVRVEVTIGDINDNAPVFQELPYKKSVEQGLNAGMLVLTVKALDKDAGVNGDVKYQLQSDATSGKYFEISSSTGAITTKLALGTEAVGYHNLKVIATDKAQNPLSSTGVVEITVGSGGVNSLQFENQNYSTSLHENANVGSRVITVALENKPSGVTFSFASGNDKDAFSIDSSGLITVSNSEPIDYEAYTYMRLIVSAVSGETYAYTTVWVNLIDVNDNKPKFSQDKYVTKVYEGSARDTYVMQVTATDADSQGPNSDIIHYNIIQGNIDDAFIIEPIYSGIIKTNVMIDYEIRQQYRLIIEAKDNGNNKTLSSTCTVKISVIDINDNPPKLPTTKPVYISETTEVGSVITMVTANDIDVSPPVMYNFSADGNPSNMFSIDHYSGMIRLSKQLDYERRQYYVVGIQASDTKHIAYTNLDIYVIDENDHAPTFSQQSYKVSLAELTPADTSVIKVNATDADSGENSHITYSLATSLTDSFYINEQTGVIYTKDVVMYQSNQEIIQLVVKATDNGTLPLSAVVAVYIQISSVNNYTPEFIKPSYVASVSEDTQRGFVVLHVEAIDGDTSGRNKEIDYRIVQGNTDGIFMIDQKGGRIMLNGVLDREREQEYNLVVMAKDRGLRPRNSSVNVQIIVQDVNDKVPYFKPGNCDNGEYCKVLNESYPDDVAFLKVTALDDDIGANSKIYYTITSGNDEGLFIVNGATGELFILPNETLDYERHSYHKLIIKAMDCSGCEAQSPRYSNFTTVHINVTDVNEYDPEFPVSNYFEAVKENMTVGSSVFKVHANDKDGGDFGVVEYVLSGSTEFSILPSGYITTNQLFDYETASKREFQFQVTATDKGGRSTTVAVFLYLEDVDEYYPRFRTNDYTFEIPGRATKGSFIGRVNAIDEDGGSAGKIVYQLAVPHNYFGVNASTGEIRVTHDLNREIPESHRRKREVNNLVIVASSGLEGSKNASVVVDVNVDRACQGCEMQYIVKEPSTAGASMNVVIIVVVLVSVIAIVLLVIIVVILVRRRKQGKTPPPSETPMCDDEFDTLPHPTNNGPPVYGDVIRYQGKYGGGNVTTSSDMSGHSHNSGSSGRGSAEDDEDEELAMINSSSPNYLNNSNGFRKNMPDSGIQDDDNTSEPSVQNHQDYLARLGIDTAKINSKAKSGLTHSVESMHQFSDSGGGEGVGLEIDNLDYTKLQPTHVTHENMMDKNNDMGFHEPEPHMGGSLSNVINSEEEYSGSYNWDYLLDWGPQYQPLAHVFSEIARLKDDTIQPRKQVVQIVPQRQLSANANVQPQVRMVPPPMITNAPPKAITQPVSRSNRSSHSSGVSNMNSRNSTINTSLPSMPRSPISHESSFTSPALTPSFTPSLSPLATRSPSVSPVNSGRGMVSNHSSGQTTPRSRNLNLNNNNKFVFSSSSSEQELRI